MFVQLYLVAEFVSYPKNSASKRESAKSPTKPTSALQADSSDTKHPAVQSILTDVLSGSVSSSGVTTPTTNRNGDASVKGENGTMHEQITKRVASKVRSDGSVLHCLAVSSYCFKIGRLTVPPVSTLSDNALHPRN